MNKIKEIFIRSIPFIVLSVLMIGFGYVTVYSFQRANEHTALSPKFKVGDCFTSTKQLTEPLEAWEKRFYMVEKVIIVGNTKYRTLIEIYKGRVVESTSDFDWDSIMTKVECTEALKD